MPEAEYNLRMLGLFIAEDNPIRAISFVEEIRQKALSIGFAPYAYPKYIPNPFYRKKSHKGYIIFYTVQNETVYITHILNSIRDYSKLLK